MPSVTVEVLSWDLFHHWRSNYAVSWDYLYCHIQAWTLIGLNQPLSTVIGAEEGL